MQSPSSFARMTMATPAVLLFLVACSAQLIAGIRGGDGGGGGNYLVRGSIVDEGDGDGRVDIDHIGGGSNEDGAPIHLDHRHGHHRDGGRGNDGNNNNNGVPSNSQRDDDDDDSFDFYVYSMSYQPEFCEANGEKFAGCKTPKDAWKGQLTIHGLWPNRNDGTWPSACSDEEFDLSLLADVSTDLAQNWPNVKAPVAASPGHEAFWAHEWSKHGTCSGLTQQDYFMTALDLLLPTPSVVKENYGSVAKRKDLEEGYLGSDMSVFVCKRGYLSEVRVCFEKTGDGSPGERVTCPPSLLKSDSCGGEIKIARFGNSASVAAE